MNTEANTIAARADFLSDCRIMLRFARNNGADLLPELRRDIARLDSLLIRLKQEPVSDIPKEVLSSEPETAHPTSQSTVVESAKAANAEEAIVQRPDAEQAAESVTELILKVHQTLSTVVTPATPYSLYTTVGSPWVVKFAAGMAIVSALAFAVSASVIANKNLKAVATVEAEKKKEKEKADDEKKVRAAADKAVEGAPKAAKADDGKAENSKAESKK
jgi:hypothetical protein